MMVKICGITNLEDALAAVEAGATALGFIFYPKSPRYVTPEEAGRITSQVPPGVLRVGVFVDETPREILRILHAAQLDVAQLHGHEPPSRIPAGIRAWKAFRVTPEWSAHTLEPYRTEAFLLDAPLQGQAFDWTRAAGLRQRIVIAGGLDHSNVRAAITAVAPWGVDACSRVEREPGLKDHAKVRRFVQEALRTCM